LGVKRKSRRLQLPRELHSTPSKWRDVTTNIEVELISPPP